jgi:hypothetical protein
MCQWLDENLGIACAVATVELPHQIHPSIARLVSVVDLQGAAEQFGGMGRISHNLRASRLKLARRIIECLQHLFLCDTIERSLNNRDPVVKVEMEAGLRVCVFENVFFEMEAGLRVCVFENVFFFSAPVQARLQYQIIISRAMAMENNGQVSTAMEVSLLSLLSLLLGSSKFTPSSVFLFSW